ncbi:hypothetical protein FHX49_002042 [Microbacterium endophyticum]|uniref:Alpha/beta hydrolase n=1 Tax=Microbacterium endophyticum TaxID=1526412 RepID=A0A7W4V426_9MICO|nr:hypothetical protein [Microbacterium endophyticum]MBB2976467.1 hypothetical protein [Microbacterium endophyticum]NIK35913.1 hypothetical protein [Microbacterium endophyticum]
MSDDLDITSGAVVAVDTAALRDTADRLVSCAQELTAVENEFQAIHLRLFASTSTNIWTVLSRIQGAVERAHNTATTAIEMATALRTSAAVYEVVELRAQRELAAVSGHTIEIGLIDDKLRVLAHEWPEAAAAADDLVAEWSRERSSELQHQGSQLARPWTPLLGLTPALAALILPWGISHAATGKVGSGTTLTGVVTPVRVTPLTATTGVAPRGLADAASRIPGGEQARVRVEKYAMTDGTKRFAVYITGTQSWSRKGQEPWNLTSNLELYDEKRSASYEATLAALHDAGAESGDTIYAFGHSQGAMVASHIALSGEFDTRALVTFGSPVDAAVSEQTLSIQVRHDDDIVSALAAGGHAAAVGAEGSFVAHRVADPEVGFHDFTLPAHHMTVYADTAAMLDDSSDPRMNQVRDVFADLADADSVRVTEYGALDISPDAVAEG